MHIKLTPTQVEARAAIIRERLERPIALIVQDIERERAESDANYIWWISRGGKP